MSPPETDTNDTTDETLAEEDSLAADDAAEESTDEEEKQPVTLEVSIDERSACQRHVTV
ncbi:MAG: hypothetical protein IH991_22060, partial [Planctomycetes bacterium]|nr:hypothetical protein [Planctomycetota bacterium]